MASGFRCFLSSNCLTFIDLVDFGCSQYPAPESCWIICDTKSATTLNQSIILSMCLGYGHGWNPVVGFPPNQFSLYDLLWMHGMTFSSSDISLLCSGNHHVLSIRNIQCPDSMRDSTYRKKFASTTRESYGYFPVSHLLFHLFDISLAAGDQGFMEQ